MSAAENVLFEENAGPALIPVASSALLGASGMVIAWKTPPSLFQTLNAEFGFTVDVCASDWNHQCPKYWTVDTDGLAQEWEGVCWCNPPFDASKGKWTEKAWISAQRGCTAVVLLAVNATEDTEWWHRYATRSSEIRYVRGRPEFIGVDGARVAMRCVLLVMRPGCKGPPLVSSVDKHGRAYAPNDQALRPRTPGLPSAPDVAE